MNNQAIDEHVESRKEHIAQRGQEVVDVKFQKKESIFDAE